MSDFTQKLRTIVERGARLTQRQQWAYLEAADQIERLERLNEALTKTLEVAQSDAQVRSSLPPEAGEKAMQLLRDIDADRQCRLTGVLWNRLWDLTESGEREPQSGGTRG